MSLPILGSWATATSYPAIPITPWAGQLIKQKPGYSYFTPGVAAAATEMNWLINQIVQMYQISIETALDNWSAGVSATSLQASGTFQAFAWDATYARWVGIVSVPATSTTLFDTLDGGRTWTSCGSGNVTGATILSMAANAGLLLFLNQNNSHAIGSVDTAGATHDFIVSSMTAGTAFWYPAANEFVIVAGSQSGGTFTGAAYTTSGTSAPTDVHASLPAAWQTSTNHTSSMVSAVGNGDAIVASSLTTIGTDTSRLLHVTFPSSTLTFTDVTPAAFSGHQIFQVFWDSANSLWGVLTFDGTSSHIYTSPDLSTWALAATFSSQTALGACAIAGHWAVVLPFPNSTLHANTARVFLSTDQGATWHATASKASSSGVVWPTTAGVVAGGNGLVFANSAIAYVSQQVGMT